MDGSKVPVLSAVNDDPMSTTLSASLMISAEASRPWSIIGFDQWIGAGKWWLLRAQLELRTIIAPEQRVSPAAYADLIKAGWILVDVIPCHPQFPFVSASRSSELRSLSAEVKNEFSRITALAMVVPALGELSSQHLRLWESVPIKAPILRPYKVSQDLNAWRADGGEHVLFRGFACHSLTTRPCILLFFVHESAKAAKLIAQDQYGDIFIAISIQEYVNLGHSSILQSPQKPRLDGKAIKLGKEGFVLNHVREAHVLCSMIEATTFYIVGRQADHASLEDLKAYMLLTAVKNQNKEAVAQIRQEICKTDDIVESDQRGSLAQLAVAMASQWIKGRLLWDDICDWNYPTFRLPLFDWAVVCNHTTLTEFLLSEDPVVEGNDGYWHETRLNSFELSAAYGNEAVVRWCLNDTRGRDMNVTSSLYHAIRRGHANVVALLIDAGVVLHDSYDLTHQALRSPLSEVVIHAILAMAYATKSGSDIGLRQAADRGHEGAVVLLSYAETLKRRDSPLYSRPLTHDHGYLKQVVATLARVPDIIPAFDLTLMTVERRRTIVYLEVEELPPNGDMMIYLDSYHAYIEGVSEGLSKYLKKAIKVEMSGRSLFMVAHQERKLQFTVWRSRPYIESYVIFKGGGNRIMATLDGDGSKGVVMPINPLYIEPDLESLDRSQTEDTSHGNETTLR